jgi:hypothetical protein
LKITGGSDKKILDNALFVILNYTTLLKIFVATKPKFFGKIKNATVDPANY